MCIHRNVRIFYAANVEVAESEAMRFFEKLNIHIRVSTTKNTTVFAMAVGSAGRSSSGISLPCVVVVVVFVVVVVIVSPTTSQSSADVSFSIHRTFSICD